MNPVTDLLLTSIQAGGGVWVQWVNPLDVDFDHVRLLRVVGAGPITGPTDANATVIFEGKGAISPDFRNIHLPDPVLAPGQARTVLDVQVVPNQLYTYAIFATNDDGSVFSAVTSGGVTSSEMAILNEPDVVQILVDYLETGLARALASGALLIPKKFQDTFNGAIDVVKAPPRLDQTTWPVVSIHLDEDGASDYALGDMVASYDLTEGHSLDHVGYISMLSISIGGWAADHPALRHGLYRTLKGLLMGARHLLDACGVIKSEFSGAHREDFQTYDLPMYSAEFHLRAWVVSRVEHLRGATIDDIDITHADSQTAVC